MADSDVQDWLLNQGRRCKSIAQLLEGTCAALRAKSIEIDRATLGAPLLHPIAQSSFASWSEEEGGRDNWFIWTPDNVEALRNSPIHEVYESGQARRLKLEDERDRSRFGIGEDLFSQGFCEYITLPLNFSDDTFKVFTCATRRANGFTDPEYDALQSICTALSAALETLVLKNTTKVLLDTYVGKRAGEKVLSGDIHRGDGSYIPAVIWFSDLRGFTAMSAETDEKELLNRLNTYFEVVTDAIAGNKGETLKFIGDAVLAIFPIEEEPHAAAVLALRAAQTALSFQQKPEWPSDLEFGLALHVGEVFFGNVGGKDRLDFTVIGSQVNITNRIEGLCSVLDENLLVSQEFKDICPGKYQDKGWQELKGITGSVRVYAPRLQ